MPVANARPTLKLSGQRLLCRTEVAERGYTVIPDEFHETPLYGTDVRALANPCPGMPFLNSSLESLFTTNSLWAIANIWTVNYWLSGTLVACVCRGCQSVLNIIVGQLEPFALSDLPLTVELVCVTTAEHRLST